ncbi:MAG: hypothetical protein P8L85_04130 [Rubripirellula sp.]|nr:hypothetical protein [Rubripirellula sp.]
MLKIASGGDAMPEPSCRPIPNYDPLQDCDPLPGLIGSLRKKQQQDRADRSARLSTGETGHDKIDRLHTPDACKNSIASKASNASETADPAAS